MDKFGDIPAQARDLAGRVAEHGREVGDKLQEVPGNVKGAIDKSLKQQPMATLALAAVVGFVLRRHLEFIASFSPHISLS
jgi:ElaB/YqjD/DUF883 family membrane-anchored ribosome-binding protein